MQKAANSLVSIIKSDHKVVSGLFTKFQAAKNPIERKDIANNIVKELSVHSAAEEEVVYPAYRKKMSEGNKVADQSINEHQKLKELLYDIDNMEPEHPQFVTKMNSVIKETLEHVKHEEESWLPKFSSSMTTKELDDLAEQFKKAKSHVPTRPHPMAPANPPLNVPINMATAPLDKMKDAMEGRK